MSTAGADWVIRPTEMKSTPVSAIARMVSRSTPPEASSGTRPATSATASRKDRGRHVVEQQTVGSGGERGLDLLDPVDLDLDLEAGVRRLGAPHRLGDTAAHRDMVVLDQHPVAEPHPVVVRAAHPRRIFVERAKARNGLARVEQRRAGAGDRVDIAAGQGRDARKVLERVERRAFGREHRSGIARAGASGPSRLQLVRRRSPAARCVHRGRARGRRPPQYPDPRRRSARGKSSRR